VETTAQRAVRLLTERGLTVATCESLTAGLVSARIADVPGASAVLRGGLVTYATDLKGSLAGVDAARLESHGPVDGEVARQMAEGARRVCGSDLGMATTGVAGPDPVGEHAAGTVWIAVTGAEPRLLHLAGDRSAIRAQTVEAVLELLSEQAAATSSSSNCE
jgi:nicotinamide-nucleotide amidase